MRMRQSVYKYLILFILLTAGVVAQPVAPAVSEGEASDATALDVPDADLVARAEESAALQRRIEEIETQLGEYAALEAASEAGLAEYTLESVQARIGVLRKLQAALQRHVSALREYEDITEQRLLFDAEFGEYQRLSEDPPYTMAFFDNLRSMVDHKQMDVEAEVLTLRALRELVSMERNDIPIARATLNRAAERLRTASQTERGQAQFEVDTARLLEEANAAELRSAEMEVQRTEAHVSLLEADLDLARRRVEIARAQTLFRQDELDAVRERQEAAIVALVEEGQKARDQIDRLRAHIPTVERAFERAPDPEAQQRSREELDLLRRQVEAARIHLAITESLQDYEREVMLLWERRFEVANPMLAQERLDWTAIAARLRERLELLQRERSAGDRRAMSLRGQITTLERRLADWKPEDGDKRIAEQQLLVLRERESVRSRIQLRLAEIASLVERIHEEVRARQVGRSYRARISDITNTVLSYVRLAFDREITEIGGESITGRKVFYMIIILVGGILVSRIGTRFLVRRTLEKFHLRSNVVLIFAKLTNYALFLLVVYLALNYVNIPLTIFTFMGGAIALGIGFGAQNLINNFLSGLILMGEQPIRLGDIVEVDGKMGVVSNIGARASRLRMFNGFDLLIPNSTFLETNLINWTLSDQAVRLQVEVGVAYGSATRDVSRLIMRAVSEHGLVLDDPEPKVIFESFGENALHFSVYFWINLGPNIDGRVIMSDVRHRIDKLFKEGGIVVAFPQRDIHLDTSDPLEICLSSAETKADDAKSQENTGDDGQPKGKLP